MSYSARIALRIASMRRNIHISYFFQIVHFILSCLLCLRTHMFNVNRKISLRSVDVLDMDTSQTACCVSTHKFIFSTSREYHSFGHRGDYEMNTLSQAMRRLIARVDCRRFHLCPHNLLMSDRNQSGTKEHQGCSVSNGSEVNCPNYYTKG